MKENNNNPEQNYNTINNAPQVLSFEDERKLVMATANHPFGIIIRLPLFSGITLSEMLALCWSQVDFTGGRIYIINEVDTSGNVPVLRPATARRSIPLPIHVMQDLSEWYNFHISTYVHRANQCFGDQPVAKAAFGDILSASDIEAGCQDLCVRAGVTPVRYMDLRHTFAVRALEQGMDPNILNCILGVGNAGSFYQSFYNFARAGYCGLVDALVTVHNYSINHLAYPVVITPLEDGKMKLYAPDFPDVVFISEELIAGLIQIQNKITQECECRLYPVAPTAPIDLDAQVPFGSFAVLIPVSV